MSKVWKVAVGLVVALMLPAAAYATGMLTAPDDSSAPRKDIVIVDSPSRSKASDRTTGPGKAEREAREQRRERQDKKSAARDNREAVKVVTPQPTPVNESNNNAGADDGDDDRDDDGDDGDDDDAGDDDGDD
jgi:hypothetical protein